MSETSSGKSPGGSPSRRDSYELALKRFWARSVKLMLLLLLAWAIVGLGCGVLFADYLNQFRIGGFPLGFWFAQQGSIIGFVLIILIFCVAMNKRDEAHARENEGFDSKSGGGI